MEFRIADTFTDSLSRLTAQEQKAVKTTAFDLQLDASAPGLSFHKLDRAKDPNFWSVRVNADIRLIVHPDHAVTDVLDLDVGLAEDDEEVARAGRFQVAAHMQVGVHAGFQYRHAAELVELGGMGVVVEGAGDQHVETGIPGFARRRHQVGAGYGAEFGADKDARTLFAIALHEGALGADETAGPAG